MDRIKNWHVWLRVVNYTNYDSKAHKQSRDAKVTGGQMKIIFFLIKYHIDLSNNVNFWTQNGVYIMSTSFNPNVTRVILMFVFSSKLCQMAFKYRCPKKKSDHSRPTYLSDDGTSHHSSCMIGYSRCLTSMAPCGCSLFCWTFLLSLTLCHRESSHVGGPQLDIFLFESAVTDLRYLRWIHSQLYCNMKSIVLAFLTQQIVFLVN